MTRSSNSSVWARVAVAIAAAVGGAISGWILGDLLDPSANAFLLGTAALLFALANFAVPRVQVVFDHVLNDIQPLDEERIRRFEVYVAAHRRKMLVSYLLAFLIGLVPACAAGVLVGVSFLKKPESASDWLTVRLLCTGGYAGLFLFVPALWRPIRLVLQVNDFRQEVLDVVRREKRRAEMLAAADLPPVLRRVDPEATIAATAGARR